jgi:hypothetical protein
MRWDSSRRSLLDLVIGSLLGAIALSDYDLATTNLDRQPARSGVDLTDLRLLVHTAAREQSYPSIPDFERDPLRKKAGNDDAKEILSRLRRLATYSGWEDYFETGIAFGQITSNNVGSYEESEQELVQDAAQIAHATSEVRKAHWINAFPNFLADLSLLEWYADRVATSEYDPDFGSHLASIANRCIGHVIGLLSQLDRPAKAPFDLTVPRSVRDLFDANGDKIRNAIQEAERILCTSNPNRISNEMIIRHIGACVEAIAKRTWTSSSKVYDILKEKRSGGSKAEQRVAGIGIMLLQLYRNPAQHEMDSFECSIDEVHLFLWGLRVMLRLSLEITPVQ